VGLTVIPDTIALDIGLVARPCHKNMIIKKKTTKKKNQHKKKTNEEKDKNPN